MGNGLPRAWRIAGLAVAITLAHWWWMPASSWVRAAEALVALGALGLAWGGRPTGSGVFRFAFISGALGIFLFVIDPLEETAREHEALGLARQCSAAVNRDRRRVTWALDRTAPFRVSWTWLRYGRPVKEARPATPPKAAPPAGTEIAPVPGFRVIADDPEDSYTLRLGWSDLRAKLIRSLLHPSAWPSLQSRAEHLLHLELGYVLGFQTGHRSMFLLEPTSAVRRTGAHELTVRLDPGPFVHHEAALEAAIEAYWTQPPNRIRVEWRPGDESAFRLVYDPGADSNHVLPRERELHLQQEVEQGTVAHELGHVLGFADHYQYYRVAETCEMERTGYAGDLMAEGSAGKVSAGHWRTLLDAYPERAPARKLVYLLSDLAPSAPRASNRVSAEGTWILAGREEEARFHQVGDRIEGELLTARPDGRGWNLHRHALRGRIDPYEKQAGFVVDGDDAPYGSFYGIVRPGRALEGELSSRDERRGQPVTLLALRPRAPEPVPDAPFVLTQCDDKNGYRVEKRRVLFVPKAGAAAPLPRADARTFHSFTKMGCGEFQFGADARAVYVGGERLPHADPASFRAFPKADPFHAEDKSFRYFGRNALPKSGVTSARRVGRFLVAQVHGVSRTFDTERERDEFDAATLAEHGNYLRDAFYVYDRDGLPLPQLDAASFEAVPGVRWLERDRRHVYYYGIRVEGASPRGPFRGLVIDGQKTPFWTDGQRTYCQNQDTGEFRGWSDARILWANTLIVLVDGVTYADCQKLPLAAGEHLTSSTYDSGTLLVGTDRQVVCVRKRKAPVAFPVEAGDTVRSPASQKLRDAGISLTDGKWNYDANCVRTLIGSERSVSAK